MNSLKKIAAVSGIICTITLVAAIILTPFAVSSAMDFYNTLVDRAEASADQYWTDCSIDSTVTDLTLAESGYYGMIFIRESADNQIHIRNQDTGFEYIQPNVTLHGSQAEVHFQWITDPKLTEENFMQLMAAQFFSNYRYQTIIELPASVSLHFAEENMGDLYYHVDLEFTGFANYEELRSQLDGWAAALEARNAYESYISSVNDGLTQIENLRYELASNAENAINAELFQLDTADLYVEIKNRRSDLLKRSYNFRKEYGPQTAEELDAVYLEMNSLIEELCSHEKQYDYLSAKVNEAREQMEMGEIDEEQFSTVADTCYSQQVDLDLTIGKQRDKLETFLREEILPMSDGSPDMDSTTAILLPESETPAMEIVIAPTGEVTTVTPAADAPTASETSTAVSPTGKSTTVTTPSAN